MDLKEEDILGTDIGDHWYYVAKGRAMTSYLGGRTAPEVLDVGAGSGVFAKQLLEKGVCDSAVCVDPNYAAESDEWHQGKRISFVRDAGSGTYDLVLMMDVLEHVADDVALLESYANRLSDDGRLFITVPAFQFLWSGHDEFLEHHRRYTIRSLEKVVRAAGLTPIKSRYFFGGLFPAVILLRVLGNLLRKLKPSAARSELRVYPKWINRILINLHDLERCTIFRFNVIAGLSVVSLCRKAQ